MKRMIDYPKIKQFKDSTSELFKHIRFVKKNEDGKDIYDMSRKLPKIEVIASEKIHGTNGSVAYSEDLGLWVQSRKRIITPEDDNYNCASFIMNKKEFWIKTLKDLAIENNIDLKCNIVVIYFELAGDGVQSTSACTNLSRRAIIFKYFRSISVDPENEKKQWFETNVNGNWVEDEESSIFNIMNFPVYSFEIDFNNPKKSTNDMLEVMNKVESESPVGKAMGQDGNIGESIVCDFLYKGKRFAWKVKGDKHSKSRIKKLSKVDMEKLDKKEKLIESITPNWRFEQGLKEIFGHDYKENISREKMGDYIRWVANDTLQEEKLSIEESGIKVNEIMKSVTHKAVEYFNKVEMEID